MTPSRRLVVATTVRVGAVGVFAAGLVLSTVGVGTDSGPESDPRAVRPTSPARMVTGPTGPTAPTGPTVVAAGGPPGTETSGPTTSIVRRSAATRVAYVSIPALGTTAVVIDLGLGPAGELEVPHDVSQAGWFTGGALPGQVGPAVIVGHRDSYAGPAVFARLGLLRPDDVIDVTLDDGTTVRHRVVRVDRVAKDRFPTEQVYGSTSRPELRLITCDGVFDRGERSYEGNLVVHAVVA